MKVGYGFGMRGFLGAEDSVLSVLSVSGFRKKKGSQPFRALGKKGFAA